MSSDSNVLLLSGYHAASHRYWSEQLVSGLPHFGWTSIALPDRHFYWRVRSNALTFAYQHPAVNENYDLIVATSMVDLCNLRGLLPHLGSASTLLYFHENQFAYPQRQANNNLINAQLTSIYSALVADKLVFNSEYNRDSFFEGARQLLAKMPDGTPKNLLDELPTRSIVVPVPVREELSSLMTANNNKTVEILWNHRWEYDKQPQVFFAAIKKLLATGVRVSLHVMGQSFRQTPDCFNEFQKDHGDCIVTWGFQPIEKYQQILASADIVVSAALHDFQGLGMQEAIAAGCIPIAPDRMAYPEYICKEYLYSVTAPDSATLSEAQEVDMLYQKLLWIIETSAKPTVRLQTAIQRYKTSELLPIYDRLISSLI